MRGRCIACVFRSLWLLEFLYESIDLLINGVVEVDAARRPEDHVQDDEHQAGAVEELGKSQSHRVVLVRGKACVCCAMGGAEIDI